MFAASENVHPLLYPLRENINRTNCGKFRTILSHHAFTRLFALTRAMGASVERLRSRLRFSQGTTIKRLQMQRSAVLKRAAQQVPAELYVVDRPLDEKRQYKFELAPE